MPYRRSGSPCTFLEVSFTPVPPYDVPLTAVPIAINLVNSSTPYVYDARTQTYGQPAYAQQLLKRFADVNEALIKNMKVQGSYPFEERTIGSTSTLTDLINIGLEFSHHAPTVLNTLLSELAKQTQYVLPDTSAVTSH